MKVGWDTEQRLGDLFKTSAGGTPSTTKREYYDGGTIPWLMSGEMRQGVIRSAKTFITEQGLQNSNAKVFPKETVLVALYGATAGQIGILDIEAATNQAVFGIYPNSGFAPKFIFYLLLSRYDDLVSQAVGNAQPNLSGLKIKNVPVPSISLAEQQRIVGILDAAFEGIATAKANAEKNLQNARALFESHLQSVFTQRGEGWVEKRLVEVCYVDRGSSPRPIKKYFTEAADGVNWIKIGDATEGEKFITSTAQKITPEGARESVFVKEGDFLLTNSMSFGRAYIMKTQGYIHDGWFCLRLNETIDTDYFYYLLTSPYVRDQFNRLAAGAIVLNISSELVKKAVLPIPPIETQRQIAVGLEAYSAETQRLATIYERKLAALDDLKKSLLHRAFSGEL